MVQLIAMLLIQVVVVVVVAVILLVFIVVAVAVVSDSNFGCLLAIDRIVNGGVCRIDHISAV